MTKRRFVLAICCVLALATSAFGQAGTGQVSGTVMDASGAVIAGAAVKVTSDRTGAVRTATTSQSGTFVVSSLPAGRYTVEITYSGFQPHTVKDLDVSVGADHPIKATLATGTVASTVTVSEMAVTVQTSEAAVSSLIDGETLVKLPLNRRNPLHFIGLIPGVVGHSSTATSSTGTVTHQINGDRGRGIQTTLDGIDIGDPVIPRGELTNAPVNPDMLEEFRITTTVPRAEQGRNSGAQVEMVMKSGSNDFHGSAYEFFRNTVLDARAYFGTSRELLKQNQFGATAGGAIMKSKLFYFGSYEGTRRTQSFLQNNTALTDTARQGLFRYVRGTMNVNGTNFSQLSTALVDPATGNLVSGVPTCGPDPVGGPFPTNCLATYDIAANDPRALGLDPLMVALANVYPSVNNFSSGDGLNTGFYSFNSPTQAPADTYAWKIDYNHSQKYQIWGRYTLAWRNHLLGDFINGGLPRTPNSGIGRSRLSRNQSGAAGVKMVLSNTWVNDVTVGITRNTLFFADTSHPIRSGHPTFGSVPELVPASYTSPFVLWGGTERHPENLQIRDSARWQRGAHAFSFGGDWRFYRYNNLRNVGSNPQGSGISVFPSLRFTSGVVPFTGVNSPTPGTVTMNNADNTRLQNLFNELLGIVAQMDQVMYSDGTQYQPGGGLVMYQRQKEWSAYFQDDWRVTPRLTLNLGIRYELFGVPYDAGGLQVVPDQPMNQPGVTFLPGGPQGGRDWYKTDRNNFAPALGLAWDPRGDGKTAVRAGYRVAYNRMVGWALNVVEQRQPAIARDPQIRGQCLNTGNGNFGGCGQIDPSGGTFTQPLRIGEMSTHPSVTVVNGIPSLSAPNPNVIQSTPFNNRAEAPFFFADDFATALVHQFSLNVQHEIAPGLVAEIGYVGSRGTKLFRFLNVNQMELNSNGFLQEFINAQTNMRICQQNSTACLAAQITAGVTAGNRTTSNFANWGLTGQVALPIFSPLFSLTSLQTAAGFRDTTNVTNLNQNNLGGLADRMDKALGGSRGPCIYPTPNAPTGPCTAVLPGGDFFFRPNTQFDVAGIGASNSNSYYNALQMQIRGSWRSGLQFAANYSWQKSIDDQSDETVGAGTGFSFPFDSNNVRTSRARSDFDVNHVVRGYVIYDLPFGRGKKWGNDWEPFLRTLLGGWQINSIVDISSGFPFTVSSGVQSENYFITSPANCGAGAEEFNFMMKQFPGRPGVFLFPSQVRQSTVNVTTSPTSNTSWLFTVPAAGTLGTCGRNTFTGPAFTQFDFGILKTFDIRENMKIDVRTELFNAFNTANYSNPGTLSILSANFGQITSTRAPNRIMQFALKLTW